MFSMIFPIIALVLIFFVLSGSEKVLSIIDPKIERLGQSIATKGEGFGADPNNFPTRNNNPGDLVDTSTGQKRIFGTTTEGWQALYHQLELVQLGVSRHLSKSQTWYEFAQTWTGGDNSRQWAEAVSSDLGVDPNSTVEEYLTGQNG